MLHGFLTVGLDLFKDIRRLQSKLHDKSAGHPRLKDQWRPYITVAETEFSSWVQNFRYVQQFHNQMPNKTMWSVPNSLTH